MGAASFCAGSALYADVASPSIGRTRSDRRLLRSRLAGGQPTNPRSGIEPNARELQIRLAHFGRVRLARPFDALFGHGAVMRGRFHGNAPNPQS